MIIDAKVMNERLERLRRERQEHRDLMIAYDGAIQEAEYWLKTLESTQKVSSISSDTDGKTKRVQG